jgi:hypothetical protein
MQVVITNPDSNEAFAMLQDSLSSTWPWAMPSLYTPLVLAAPFGSGKRAVVQRLVRSLPGVLQVVPIVTSRPRGPDEAGEGEHQ